VLWKVRAKEAAGRTRLAGRLAFRKHLPEDLCGSSGREPGGPTTMERRLTRGRFLAGGAAVAGALAWPARLLAAPKTTAIYRLETGCGDGSCACGACRRHDRYSLFPSSKAANGNRAHVGCNCLISKGSIDYGTYVALFGNPAHLRAYRVDTRWPWVQAILKQHPPRF
jgi:hypothetical protein